MNLTYFAISMGFLVLFIFSIFWLRWQRRKYQRELEEGQTKPEIRFDFDDEDIQVDARGWQPVKPSPAWPLTIASFLGFIATLIQAF